MEMATILDRLAAYAAQRTAEKKKTVSLEEIREKAIARYKEQAAGTAFSFERALSGGGMHFICECKKASPSKGLIAPDFPYMEIARSYEAAGASAISVLTEPGWFLGENRFLKEISEAVSIPCLRKDFTVDSYMIYEANLLGASAVLLICAILDDVRLAEYLEIAHSLGLSALVEAHDETEVRRALAAGARIIGVNNRDLHTFEVDINNSVRLRSLVPSDRIYVSESGIRNAGDVGVLYRNGTNAVLIGETLMRSLDKGAQLRELRSRCKKTLEKRLTEPCVRNV